MIIYVDKFFFFGYSGDSISIELLQGLRSILNSDVAFGDLS